MCLKESGYKNWVLIGDKLYIWFMPVITNVWTKTPRIRPEGSEINCIGWHQHAAVTGSGDAASTPWFLAVRFYETKWLQMNECNTSLASSRSFRDRDNANIHANSYHQTEKTKFGWSVVSFRTPSALTCSYSSSLTSLNTRTSPPNFFILCVRGSWPGFPASNPRPASGCALIMSSVLAGSGSTAGSAFLTETAVFFLTLS